MRSTRRLPLMLLATAMLSLFAQLVLAQGTDADPQEVADQALTVAPSDISGTVSILLAIIFLVLVVGVSLISPRRGHLD